MAVETAIPRGFEAPPPGVGIPPVLDTQQQITESAEAPLLRQPYLIINKRGRFEFSRLPEEDVYQASGLEFPRVDPTLDLSIQPRYIPSVEKPIFVPDAEGINRDGFEIEERVGKIIGRLSSVESVRQTEPMTELVDLLVTTRDGETVKVQVKTSHWGVIRFYKEVGARLGKSGNLDDPEYLRRREWMAKEGLILINGGFKKSETVSDQYIAEKFAREMDLLTWRRAARAIAKKK